MNIFSVSFFGHRQIDNPLQIESQLEEIISSLLKREEYIEFWSDVTVNSTSSYPQPYADAKEEFGTIIVL